ncbi:MAG: acyl-CoA dehydrogenase family protein [Bacteroidota bacterium]|nr:acyl-CoA dehydrogenase family protein [Bacteroidota bacterium]
MIKGGEFLIKDQEAKDIFIPEDFSEEQLMMASATREFVEKELDPHREQFEKKDYKLTEDCMKKAGELGLLGISVPEEYGGMGMPFNTSVLICDKISGANGSFSTAFGAHTGIGTLPILLYGNSVQREKYLPKLASGEWMGCYCLTEPGAGSDANSGKTKAVLTEDGKYYLITGQKMWISNAGFADVFIVFARIEDDKNITGFILEKEMEGITFGEEEHKLGLNSSSTRQVFFNEVKVPAESMLGGRENGFKIAMNALNVGRIKLSAAVLDACRRVISLSTSYSNERIQFGIPIAKFGAIRHKLADMAVRTYAIESATYRAGNEIEKNITKLESEAVDHQKAHLKGVEEYAIECSIVKVLGSETIQFCSDEGIQIYGGMGYSVDTPMEAAYRDARIARIYEGTNEINRMLLVGMILKKAMKGQLDIMGPAMKVSSELMSIPSFETPDENELFAIEKENLKKLKKAILMTAGKAAQHYAMDIEKEQEVLMNLADMVIEVYTAESAILRAEKLANNNGEQATEHQINMSKLFLYSSIKNCQKAGEEVILSFAEGDEQKMLLMGLKRFTKGYNINPKQLRRSVAEKLIEENRYCF